VILGHSNFEGNMIKLSYKEWLELWECKPIIKIVGFSKGYFKITVKAEKIEDPYKVKP
jgi:hypothetical protein